MHFSKFDRIIVDFRFQRREKATTFHFSQAKRREGGPSPIRTPTHLLKIDKKTDCSTAIVNNVATPSGINE